MKMLVKKATFKYYRCIPKGFRDYVRHVAREDYMNRSVNGKILRTPHRYRRQRGWTQGMLYDVPPAPKGGLTECYLEVYDDKNPEAKIVFVSSVKCSNKDTFSYSVGREMALRKAVAQFDVWYKDRE